MVKVIFLFISQMMLFFIQNIIKRVHSKKYPRHFQSLNNFLGNSCFTRSRAPTNSN
uniref:Candidate secreted effector n=1 Tax=Meloidogyne incognita TaxID=6306 RepID=A0A914M2M8_MELIC